MQRREIALEFLKGFCAGDVETLKSLMTEDFRLRGPLFKFDSRSDYLSSIEEDPARDAGFEVLRVFEDGEEVCLFYEFSKPQMSVVIAQLFKFRGDRIAETILVFDGRAFA